MSSPYFLRKDKQRYYLDMEFCEVPFQIEPISIGLVCEDGREFSATFHHSVAWAKAVNPWLKDHVYPWLPPREHWQDRDVVAKEIMDFFGETHKTPEIWGYFADYDWVAFCGLFGPMFQLPSFLPKYCRDLKQLADLLNVKREEFPEQEGQTHDALEDARWNKKLHEFLIQKEVAVG